MRVAVDAREIYRPTRRGAGKTLIDLYAALSAARPGWAFRLVHEQDVPAPHLDGLPNLRHDRVTLDVPGAYRFNLWEQVRFPAAAAAWRADVLHAPFNTGPRAPLARLVVTVHDLIPLDVAPDAEATKVWVRRVRAAVRAARRVMTPSEHSKGRVCDVLGVDPARVTVNPWPPDARLTRVEDPAALDRARQKYGLRPGEPYLFGFGAIDPRKNTARTVEAFAGLPAAVRDEYRLLLVGVAEPALTEYRGLADRLGVGDRVRLHGYADEADVPPLLSGATALCFASRSEGYGLPILDAFVCRTPVLTGNRTSLPEAAGDAAVLVDPDDTAAVRAGMLRLLTDAGLRAELADRGAKRVAGFTWAAAAETAARVFEEAAG